MRKVLLLLAFVIIGCLSAQAQKRYVDIKLSLDSPRNNDLVMPGNSIAIKTVLTNQGPDTLYATDSVALLMFDASANVVIYADGGVSKQYYYGFPARRLAPGDTMHLEGPRLPISASAIGSVRYCVRAMPYRDSINEMWYPAKQNLSDTGINSINNDSCVTIHVLSMSVEDDPLLSGVSVYPNPAHGVVRFSIDMPSRADVNVLLTDMAGRVAVNQQKTNLPKGRQVLNIDVSALGAGVYLYKLIAGTEVSYGKLLIE